MRTESEERYRSLIEGAAYGIYRSTAEGRILDANPALAHMLGYDSPEELMSLNMVDVYKSAEDRQALIDAYRDNTQTFSTDVTWQKKDGTPIIVRLTAHRVPMKDGSCCFDGIVEDITEKRALEEQLRQAQKMEAIGRLARGVAHDFNNVLAAIIGGADLLAFRLKPEDPARDDVEEIRKAAARGAALTKQLLTFSRTQPHQPQILDVDAAVRDLATMLEMLAGENATVQIQSTDARIQARIEPGQLEQILINLVVNARDAMANGGRIIVSVDTLRLDARSGIRYPGIPFGDYARLSVSDPGSGIDPAMQPHVFEPFFTTKGPQKGTGLGLSIVYGIAKEAGGTVTFSTKPNRGTTFEVLLPLAPITPSPHP